MTPRRLAFALLVLFAFLTPFIAPAYNVSVLLLIVWLVSLRRERRFARSLRSPIAFVLLVFSLLTVLSAIFSRDPALSVQHLAGLMLYLLVPLGADLCDTSERVRTVFFAMALSAIGLSVGGIWQFLHGGDRLANRIRGTLSHYMTFSGLALIAGCLLLGFALEAKGRWRVAGFLCVIPFTAVLLTYTRGAYVGIVAALLVYAGLRRPVSLLWLAPALVAIFLLAPQGIRDRIRSTVDITDPTNRDRIAMARAGLRMVHDYPIFGLGPDVVKFYYPLYRDPDAPRFSVPHLHNNLLQFAAANGIFAAAAYLVLVAMVLARAAHLVRRRDDPQRAALWTGALLASVALAVAGLFEYNFGDTEVEMATLLVFAALFSVASAPAAGGRGVSIPNNAG